jgi:hypothetical protein
MSTAPDAISTQYTLAQPHQILSDEPLNTSSSDDSVFPGTPKGTMTHARWPTLVSDQKTVHYDTV